MTLTNRKKIIGRTHALAAAVVVLLALLPALAWAQGPHDPTAQSAGLFYEEGRTVYLGNLARRDNGLPPLRWNHQLTLAARWFSWDSTENRPGGFCGHQDTNGKWPGDRVVAFGYTGFGGAENAFCGYLSPEDAINGWMNSSGHRANLLDPNSRETGLGYYRRSDGRGYVTQDFGTEAIYPPVVVNNEAPNTNALDVGVYIYDRQASGGFKGMQPAKEMQVSNDACFNGAQWQPYTAENSWRLASGEYGWRTVYARTRDALNRTSTVSDTIYYGPTLPTGQLSLDQLSDVSPEVTLYGLDSGGLPEVQFSLGWMADDTSENFGLLWGSGERVSDTAAMGGTAFRLGSPNGYSETSAWVWTTEFYQDAPMVAYVRLKVADNTSPAEVARFSATNTGGGDAVLHLKGTDFKAANTYQEFPLPFIFPSSETFLIFQFWRDGSTDVTVDGVTIFTAPKPFQSEMTWQVPGGAYRGQGVWVRYTDDARGFSPIQDASPNQPSLEVQPALLRMMAARQGGPMQSYLSVLARCAATSWSVASDASWLSVSAEDGAVRLTANPSGLADGPHAATVTVTPSTESKLPPVSVQVELTVVGQVYPYFAPLLAGGN